MKVVGVGLNKTGTKTLKHLLEAWGYRHQSFDLAAFNLYRQGKTKELLEWMETFDSFEDWPWPLIYREIDERFPDAVFVLTTRDTPERWYQSLCKMAVRMGPLIDFEKHVYGYSMPHGRKAEHIQQYVQHNRDVEDYFKDRPGKLLKICWDTGDNGGELAKVLGQKGLAGDAPKLNESLPVYSGDNLWAAHASRILFQSKWKIQTAFQRISRRLNRN